VHSLDIHEIANHLINDLMQLLRRRGRENRNNGIFIMMSRWVGDDDDPAASRSHPFFHIHPLKGERNRINIEVRHLILTRSTLDGRRGVLVERGLE
jgi:hypothetical protein